MDFMPNGNVGTVVRKNGPLCEWNLKIWFPAICKAIAYLHKNSIAHRLVGTKDYPWQGPKTILGLIMYPSP